MSGARTGRVWLAAALAAEVGLATVDVLTGPGFLVRSLHLLPVLALAIRGAERDVAVVGLVATTITAISPLWTGVVGQDHLIPLTAVGSGSAIAYWAARERAAADRERRQLQLLADAARITDGARDVPGALRRLVRILVPAYADAAWIDVLAPGGRPERVAADIAGPGAAELRAWLLSRGRTPRDARSPSGRALLGEGSQLTHIDAGLRAAITRDDGDRRLMERSELSSMMSVPLVVGEETLGAVSVAVGRSGRRYGPADLAFAELLVGRAALALANAQLVRRLTATQRRLDGILSALAEAVVVHDGRGRIVYANPAAARLLGVEDPEAIPRLSERELRARFAVTGPGGRPVAADDLPGVRLLRGEPAEPLLLRMLHRASGAVRWVLAKATPLEAEDGEVLAVNVFEDVTEQTKAALRQRLLAEAGEALAAAPDHGAALQRVAEVLVPRFADACAIALRDERGRLRRVAHAHAPAAPLDPDTDAGMRSRFEVPLVAGGARIGAMSFAWGPESRRHGAADEAFAADLAARTGTAVENMRLSEERARIAQTLQASLLPEQLPDAQGWESASFYRPGQRGADVGGDFYDLFPVEDGHVVLLGDVTGKGASAAAVTALVRHTAKTAAYFDPRPAAILALVNRVLYRQPTLSPVTMVCGHLREDVITLAVGGHPLPLLKRAGEPCAAVGVHGRLLGAMDPYGGAEERDLRLAPGDTLLLYTDGVTDTVGRGGRFGEARLRAAVDAAPAAPDALLRGVTAALEAFAVEEAGDDRAMLALRYVGSAVPPAAPADAAVGAGGGS